MLFDDLWIFQILLVQYAVTPSLLTTVDGWGDGYGAVSINEARQALITWNFQLKHFSILNVVGFLKLQTDCFARTKSDGPAPHDPRPTQFPPSQER